MPRVIVTEGAAKGMERCRRFLRAMAPEEGTLLTVEIKENSGSAQAVLAHLGAAALWSETHVLLATSRCA